MTYKEMVAELLSNPATSYWLRNAIDTLEERDIIDARHDVEYLATLYRVRLAEVLTEALGEEESAIEKDCAIIREALNRIENAIGNMDDAESPLGSHPYHLGRTEYALSAMREGLIEVVSFGENFMLEERLRSREALQNGRS